MRTLLQFFIFFILGFIVLRSTEGLQCYVCDGNNNDSCVTHPENELKVPYNNPNAYCLTYFRTIGGEIKLERNAEISEKNLTNVVKAGPWEETGNPERFYLNLTYCKTDLCNAQLYTPPPKLKSPIKCYVCGWDDDNCKTHVSEKYLVDARPIPSSWDKAMSFEPSSHVAKRDVAEREPPIGPFLYETFCAVEINQRSGSSSGASVRRFVDWYKKGERKDGDCTSHSDSTICFCNSQDGCNNRNGAEIIGKSLSIFIGLIVLGIRKMFL